MENIQLKEYSNASEINASEISQSTIDTLADLFFGIFDRMQNDRDTVPRMYKTG